jgi:hypothetical protein
MNRIGVKVVALVISLSLFLLACEKDIAKRGSGKKVTINFTVDRGDYGLDRQITRSEKRNDLKAETVYISLNDSCFLAATLMPEPTEDLRDSAPFAPGQKIRFVAYDGATEEDSAIYTWDGGKFVPDEDPLGVESDNGVTYHFVAYSFFGDPEAEPDEEDVEAEILPAQDLVWGEKDQEIHNTFTGRTVPILMKHKFSRVRVQVDASTIWDATITDVEGVVIAGGKKADLTVRTGTLAASSAMGSDVTATLEEWVSIDDEKAILSDDVVFYPSLTKVTIESLDIEIEGVPYPTIENIELPFSNTLTANTSYTVVVDIRANRWAYSNIYWDGSLNSGTGGLTFDKKRTNPSHEDYQGVFFKWGSLTGISPVDLYYPILYIPPIHAENWISSLRIGGGSSLVWQYIPYNLYEAIPSITPYNFYTGDICSYLDNAWRIPDESDIFARVLIIGAYDTGSDPNDETGRGSMGSGGVAISFPLSGSVFLPASGRRDHSWGELSGVGNECFYWTREEDRRWGLSAATFGFTYYNSSYTRDILDQEYGLPVRCIRKLPGE